MNRFDPIVHRPPDLWVEVDLFSASVPRESIIARLGVPEVWRYHNESLNIRVLTANGVYAETDNSQAFSFLPVSIFASFIQRMIDGDETSVLIGFREWVRTLRQGHPKCGQSLHISGIRQFRADLPPIKIQVDLGFRFQRRVGYSFIRPHG